MFNNDKNLPFSSISIANGYYKNTTSVFERTSVEFTLNTADVVFILQYWVSGKPIGIGVTKSDSTQFIHSYEVLASDSGSIWFSPLLFLNAGTYVIWTKRTSAATSANLYEVYRLLKYNP